MHSDNPYAYSNSSQRKIVNTYGYLCSVYESMGKIWLESSSDNGQTWSIINNGKPVNGNTTAKNPSISSVPGTDEIAVVFQEGSKIRIIVAYPHDVTYGNFIQYDATVVNTNGLTDANPVVAVQTTSDNGGLYSIQSVYNKLFLIIWQNNGSSTPGLYYRLLQEDYLGNYGFVSSAVKISNTNADSKNPTLTTDLDSPSSNDFHLAWEQYIDNYNTEVRYYRIHRSGLSSINFIDYYVPSNNSGFVHSIKPSITVSNTGDVNLFWVGISWAGSSGDRVVLRTRNSAGSWGSNFSQYGSYVTMVNANTTDSQDMLGFVWNENNGSQINKFRRTGMYYNGTLNTTGNYLQLSNGSDINNMYAMSFKWNITLHVFKLSSSIGNLSKSNVPNYIGREGILRHDGVEYYCTISDVNAGGERINFV